MRLKKRSNSGPTLPEQALCQMYPERIVLALTVAHGRRCEGGDLTLLLQPGPTLYKAIKLR